MPVAKPAPKMVDLSAVQQRTQVIAPAPKEWLEEWGGAKASDFTQNPYTKSTEVDEALVNKALVAFGVHVAAGQAKKARWETYRAARKVAAEKEQADVARVAAKEPPRHLNIHDLSEVSRREQRILNQVDSMTRRKHERELIGSPLGYVEWVEAGEPKS